MTAYERGDVVLLSYPVNDGLEMHLRPAMVIHDVHPSDAGIAVVPISPEPSEGYLTLYLPQGGYESARFGLLSGGYLIACPEIVVERAFVVRKIGRCPWQMLNHYFSLQRQRIVPPIVTREAQAGLAADSLASGAA
ncbi:MAG: hypothetical protein LC114_18540 [Bryobacterales bacterium]|nr:hypothetical protein [Bryobacterales bacterium]